MIRNSEHTFTSFVAAAGRIEIRQRLVWSAAMCSCLDNLDYQPKPNGMIRSQQLD